MADHSTQGTLRTVANAAAQAAHSVTSTLGLGSTPKIQQLEKEAIVANDNTSFTTAFGVPVATVDDSLKAGERGPTLLDDFVFRDRMAHFDRERIPERVVHARGIGAHGYFEAYEDLSDITMAAPFQKKGKTTPVFMRISTVQGSKGSADTVRDVRGFSVKFYTEEGNWDFVGNNIPVFFIQDAIKFPDLVHALKPEPHTEIPSGQTAHDNFWDFVSLTPESTHMLTWIMSDRTIPRSLRMIQGFGVHTFRLINKAGVSRFVKFHWRPKPGVHSLVWDEALKTNGRDPDFHRRDLYEAIQFGDYPEWELGFQILTEEEADKLPFDILDATKIIPEELFPVRYVGKMVLNRNVDEFFAETEQAAFHPGVVIPGIGFSDDPLLQGRLFSYSDTQFYRVGTNYQQLPINRPVCPARNHQRDGAMRLNITKGQANYHPNSLGGGCPVMNPNGYVHHPAKVSGVKVARRSGSFSDHFSQARMFYNSMTETEKGHMQDAFTFELSKVTTQGVQQRVVDLLNNVDNKLATSIAYRIGAKEPAAAPAPAGAAAPIPSSKFLSIINNNAYDTIKGRRVAIFLMPGYDSSAAELIGALTGAGALPQIVSETPAPVPDASGNATTTPLFTFFASSSTQFDAFFIPGGRKAVDALLQNATALAQIGEGYKHLKAILAVNEGIEVLRKLGIQAPLAVNEKDVVSEYGVTTALGVGSGVSGKVGKAIGSAVGAAGGAAAKLADVTAGLPDWIVKFTTGIAHHKAWDREPLANKMVV
ncbi:catalase [Fimicolochytrium jonesii]|uniref:catalase n=1 Tax=Fimicolochytrium jonesii TaxID=1396493 RepID=UPI0022FE2EC2|nr:catalase [Fimicolochytrium jonesii]KAI8820637.1 catalase [Fimicolochytrium jonesii]